MRHGFLKTAAVTPKIRVADPADNARAVCECLDECFERKVKLAVLPELCLTAFHQRYKRGAPSPSFKSRSSSLSF